MFSSYASANNSFVELGKNKTVKVLRTGTAEIPISAHGKRVKCMLRNVQHVPKLGFQLLTIPTFGKSGLTTSSHSKRCWISNGLKLLATDTMTGNLYKLDIHSDSETVLLPSAAEIWHLRLAHIQQSSILEMAKSKSVQGLGLSSSNKNCKTRASCVLGKAHRSIIPKQS